MRTVLALLATLLLAHLGVLAQDTPKPNALAEYLAETDAAKKAAKKAELLKLTPEQLRALMDSMPALPPGELSLGCGDGFSRKFYLRLPDEYDAAKAYPLVVLLHGGINGPSSDSALSAWLAYMNTEHKKSCFLLAPTADCDTTTMNARWWREGGMNNIEATIAWAKRRYNIDDNRVFLSGQSDGGSGAWAIAMRRNDCYAGFFPMVGHPLVAATDRTGAYYENLKGVNLYNMSGGKDAQYPGAEVTKHVNDINNCGAKILHKNFEQAGHDMSYASEELPRIFSEYIGKWQRDLLAKQIDWSTDRACFGARAWIVITETKELDKSLNKAPRATVRGTDVIRIDLGVRVESHDDPNAKVQEIKIRHLEPGGVGETMGLKKGDIITKVDGKKMNRMDDVGAAIAGKGPGKEISVTVMREGKELECKGKFPALEKDPPPGRVIGSWKPGFIDLTVNNVRRLSVRIAPAMLDAKGEIKIRVSGREAFSGKPAVVEHMLAHFEQTGDRKWPFVWEISIDVEKTLRK